jgi:hypothetical protein
MAEVVEGLPSKLKNLSSMHSTIRKKKSIVEVLVVALWEAENHKFKVHLGYVVRLDGLKWTEKKRGKRFKSYYNCQDKK